MTTTIRWAGGEHEFKLTIGDLRALQEKTGRGPEEILSRLAARTWHVDEAVETVRLGLIGGGMSRDDAKRLVSLVVDRDPLVEFRLTAFEVLSRLLYPQEADEPEKPKAPETRPEDGTSAQSTEAAS
jgi:hypothetical protein